jgi:excisionase family DNA binding protein
MQQATILPPQEGQGFVTAKPIAKFYSVTEPTIYKWAQEGKIPSTKFQGTVRFNLEAVRAAIEGQSAPSPSPPPAEILPPELEEQIEALRSRYFEEQAAMLEEVEA